MKRPTLTVSICLTFVLFAFAAMGGLADEPIRTVERIAALPPTLPAPLFEFRPMSPQMKAGMELNVKPLPPVEEETPSNPYEAYEFPADGVDRIYSPNGSPASTTSIAPVSSTRTTYTTRHTPIRRPSSQMRPQVYVGPYSGLQPTTHGGSGWIAPSHSSQSYFSGSPSPSSRPNTVFTWH
jgi:hypothetical protein